MDSSIITVFVNGVAITGTATDVAADVVTDVIDIPADFGDADDGYFDVTPAFAGVARLAAYAPAGLRP